MKQRNWFAMASAILLSGSLACKAALPGQTVIYSDFGPGFSYSTATVWGVEGASFSGGYRGQAQYFIPSFDCHLSYAELATYHKSGSTLGNYFIAEDNGAGAPGTILESFTNISTPTGLLTLNSALNPLLTAGTTYWLCMETGADSTLNGWYFNNQNVQPAFAYERSEWSWNPFGPPSPSAGTFEIVAAPVPEPSAACMMVLGVAGFLGSRAGRRSSRQPSVRAIDLPR